MNVASIFLLLGPPTLGEAGGCIIRTLKQLCAEVHVARS